MNELYGRVEEKYLEGRNNWMGEEILIKCNGKIRIRKKIIEIL
jgi:hypothetical protein